jgi:aminopeptidase N
MAKYTVRIEADKSLYPVLLSNGNLLGQGDLEVTSSVMQISLLHPQKNKKKIHYLIVLLLPLWLVAGW